MKGPTAGYDAKNAALIGGSALVGVLATVAGAGLVLKGPYSHAASSMASLDAPRPIAVSFKVTHAPESATVHVSGNRARLTVRPAVERRYEMVEHKSAAEQMFGTVRLAGARDGAAGSIRHGFLRWDRNEGSWGDALNAVRDDRGSQSSVRFGHVARIERLGDAARITLRSGETVPLRGYSTDVGPALRQLVVTDVNGAQAEFDWGDIEEVRFDPAPAGAVPPAARLHGTLKTVSGMEFTGFVAWDIDEILTSDVLDGDFQGQSYEVPFGAIASIRREGLEAVRATLHSGEELVLSGSNDVNRRNNGITVSDPGLGAVNVSWEDFADLRFHAPASEMTVHDFDGGSRLAGTVRTASGETLSGPVQWDADEAWSWETLDGWAGETEFEIEFAKIAGIAKVGDGASVTLRDGRVFHLERSNDVGRGNRGVVVSTGAGDAKVSWKDFLELILER